jgi:hypothetical protein
MQKGMASVYMWMWDDVAGVHYAKGTGDNNKKDDCRMV